MDFKSISRSVINKVLSPETVEKDGALIRRSIGSPQLRNLLPFLILDHFYGPKGSGFPDHPHRGQATVTYVTQGATQHEDSAGHTGIIREGGVQWMNASRGVIHAEMPVHGPGMPDPRGLHLWVDLPKQYKMVEPSYQELEPEDIPSAFPEGPDGPEIRVISGKSHGKESPMHPLGGCWYLHVKFKRPGKIFQELPAGWTAFIETLNGRITVGGSNATHDVFCTLVLSSVSREAGVSVTAIESNTDFVLIAAEPLDQEVVSYGPFIMTTREEIQRAFMDYNLGQNGFENAHVWKSKIGGL